MHPRRPARERDLELLRHGLGVDVPHDEEGRPVLDELMRVMRHNSSRARLATDGLATADRVPVRRVPPEQQPVAHPICDRVGVVPRRRRSVRRSLRTRSTSASGNMGSASTSASSASARSSAASAPPSTP